VGSGGAVELLGRPRAHVTVAGAPDLLGVANDAFDVFAVGAGGTIVHLQTTDVCIGEMVLL
jgi:hypothetical protein